MQDEYKALAVEKRGDRPNFQQYEWRMEVAYKQKLVATCPYLSKLLVEPYNLKLLNK